MTRRDVKFIGLFFFVVFSQTKIFSKFTEKCFQSPKQQVKRKTQFPVQQHETKKKKKTAKETPEIFFCFQ